MSRCKFMSFVIMVLMVIVFCSTLWMWDWDAPQAWEQQPQPSEVAAAKKAIATSPYAVSDHDAGAPASLRASPATAAIATATSPPHMVPDHGPPMSHTVLEKTLEWEGAEKTIIRNGKPSIYKFRFSAGTGERQGLDVKMEVTLPTGGVCGNAALNVRPGQGLVVLPGSEYCNPNPRRNNCIWPNLENRVLLSKCFARLGGICVFAADKDTPCYVRREHVYFLKLLDQASTKTMVDVGANIGDAASLFPLFGIRVVAFEALPHLSALMQLNMDLNMWLSGKAYSLRLFSTGVGAVETTVYFAGGAVVDKSFRREGFSKPIGLPIVRIGDVLAEDVGLLKMDIEGFEPEALQGSLPWLCKYSAQYLNLEFGLALLKAHSKIAPVDHLSFIRDLGFDCWCSESFDNALECLRPVPTNDPSKFVKWLATYNKKQKVDLDCEKQRPTSDAICKSHV